MKGNIFLLQGGGSLVKMKEAPYDSEDLLQELLARYPDLLAGDQIDGDEPRRWLLVSREMAVPGEEDGAGRWSLDHLFLDQDAIPTLVEVKRSSDTRIRREVVGQMLDYAANAVMYWPVESIRSRFEKTCELQRMEPTSTLTAFLRESGDCEGFWQQVKTNLQAGRIRLVFVADEIPTELRRVVEFLDGQMDPCKFWRSRSNSTSEKASSPRSFLAWSASRQSHSSERPAHPQDSRKQMRRLSFRKC